MPDGFDFVVARERYHVGENADTTVEVIDVADAAGAGGTSSTTAGAAEDALEGIPAEARTILVATFATLAVLLVLTHRWWPEACRKADLAFAGDHYVEDTHAKRMLDSRLGAAFTLSLPCVLAIAMISIFGTDNTRRAQGLEPAASLAPPLPRDNPQLFNGVTIELNAFSPASNVNCSDIVRRADTPRSSAVTCKVGHEENRWDGATFCRVRFECSVGSKLRGDRDGVQVQLPDSFQTMRWNVLPSPWDGQRVVANMTGFLGSSKDGRRVLSGTASDPTTLVFGVTRSRYRDLRGARPAKWPHKYGLQMSWLLGDKNDKSSGDTARAAAPGSGGGQDGQHDVAFQFRVQESVFVRELSDKVAVEMRLGTALTMMLSAMGLMHAIKSQLGKAIDKCLRAKKGDTPKDVKRRTVILEETFITGASFEEDASKDGPGIKRVRSRRLSEIGIEMMSGTATMRGERGAGRGGAASGSGIKVVSNPLGASDLEAKVKALEAQIQEQSRRQEDQLRRQEERWQRKFESLLQRIEGQGDTRVDVSNDKKDSEQRQQKKTEWTNPLRSKGRGAKKKKQAQKKAKAQMVGGIESAVEVLVKEDAGGGEGDHADEDDEWDTEYSEEHASVYYVNKLTRIASWKKE
jgi:hypothetical protein